MSRLANPAAANVGSSDAQLAALVATHGKLVYRIAVAIVHDHGLAEDVVQEVMVKAWTSLPDHDGDVPSRWLRTVTRNAAIDTLRRRRFDDITPDTPDDTSGRQHTVEQIVEGRDDLDRLWRALATLEPEVRAMLVLREAEDMSYQAIADTFETTTSAVKAKLYRARHTLRALTDDGGPG